MYRTFTRLLLAAFFTVALFTASGALADGYATKPDDPPKDTELTVRHWKMGRSYQKAMRLELARQEYLMALSSARHSDTVEKLQKELQAIDLQLRTLR